MPEELDSIGSSCKNDQEDHTSQQNVFQSFKKKKKKVMLTSVFRILVNNLF